MVRIAQLSDGTSVFIKPEGGSSHIAHAHFRNGTLTGEVLVGDSSFKYSGSLDRKQRKRARKYAAENAKLICDKYAEEVKKSGTRGSGTPGEE